jgi:hypothetical protein
LEAGFLGQIVHDVEDCFDRSGLAQPGWDRVQGNLVTFEVLVGGLECEWDRVVELNGSMVLGFWKKLLCVGG